MGSKSRANKSRANKSRANKSRANKLGANSKVTPVPVDATKTTGSNNGSTSGRTIRQRRVGFLDLPGELRQQIYRACKFYCVNIKAPQRIGIQAMLSINPIITKEFADIYYTENTFLLDARIPFRCHGLRALQDWKLWVEQLDERHAGMLQHLLINTPSFSATVHIPVNRAKDITITFQHRKSQGAAQLTKLISGFTAKLERFNVKLSGQRLGSKHLQALVGAIIMAVPFCCTQAAMDYRFCNTVIEADNIPKTCFCQKCIESMKEE